MFGKGRYYSFFPKRNGGFGMAVSNCENCLYYEYDEEYDSYFCSVDLDEDEAERFMTYSFRSCPYYNPGDEYTIVRKQN